MTKNITSILTKNPLFYRTFKIFFREHGFCNRCSEKAEYRNYRIKRINFLKNKQRFLIGQTVIQCRFINILTIKKKMLFASREMKWFVEIGLF